MWIDDLFSSDKEPEQKSAAEIQEDEDNARPNKGIFNGESNNISQNDSGDW